MRAQITVEEDVEIFGKEGEEESDEEDGLDQSTMTIAAAAEDELLLAQVTLTLDPQPSPSILNPKSRMSSSKLR